MSLDYLPRSAWNARASTGPTHLNANGLLGTALHWPGMGNRRLFAQADVARALRGWQDYHMDDRGWSDIAYQIAVDQAGRVWTLRGLTTRSGANGDADANAAYGAILLVVGTGESPTGALINSTRQVIADFRRLYPKANAIKPHNWVRTQYTGDGTDCPGVPVTGLIARGQFEPHLILEDSEMNDADRKYVDDRIKAYTRWTWMEQTALNLQVAKLQGYNAPTITYLTTVAAQARKEWEELTK